MNISITVANTEHLSYAEGICNLMGKAAKKRGTGIATRAPEYIRDKINEEKAVIAVDQQNDQLAGFCYIENWDHDKYIANSGLIVHPHYRKIGLGRKIKERIFQLSRDKYPEAKIFGITTSMAVMKINSDMGYKPVTFSELTKDKEFWKGCQSCPNYDILTSEDRKDCLCTGMLYDPKQEQGPSKQKAKRWEKFKRFIHLHKINIERKTKSIFNFNN